MTFAARLDAAPARVVAALVAAVGLVARALYWAVATPNNRLESDASQYDFLASNLARGQGYVDYYPQFELHATAFRPPAYPFFLSLVYRVLWPSPGIGRATNVILGVAVVAALTLLVDRHLGRRAAVVAGLTTALLPNFLANDTYVLTEPLSLLLLVALLRWVADERWALVGLTTGALILTRPSAQYLVVLLGVFLVRHVGWRRAVASLVLAALVVAPWIGRNWVELGSPVLVTSNGFNYAAMYSPPAEEAERFIDPIRDPYFHPTRLDRFDEVVWDRNLRKVAIDNVKDRPELVPKVMGRNVTAMLETAPELNRGAELSDGRSFKVRRATLWVIWPLVVLGVAGAIKNRHRTIVALASVVGAYFALASLVFVAPPRLRSPTELMLIIAASALLARPPVTTDVDWAGDDRDEESDDVEGVEAASPGWPPDGPEAELSHPASTADVPR